MSGNLNFILRTQVICFVVALGELFGDLMRELIPICKQFAVTGTTKQAKQAIRCLYINLAHGQDAVFSEILEVR
jgi:sister-chromatid-cohesion protein PDS5